MIAQRNATLTRVGRRARTDTFRDSEAGADAALWEGLAPAYFREVRERLAGGGGTGAESLLVRRSLIVENDVPPVEFESEMTVAWDFGGSSRTGIVRNVEKRVLPEAGELQTTRLTLEEV